MQKKSKYPKKLNKNYFERHLTAKGPRHSPQLKKQDFTIHNPPPPCSHEFLFPAWDNSGVQMQIFYKISRFSSVIKLNNIETVVIVSFSLQIELKAKTN